MPKFMFLIAALILSACNLTAPGAPTEVATTAPGALVQVATTTPRALVAAATFDPANRNLPTPNYATPAAAQTDWVVYTNTQNSYTIQRPRSVSLVEENNGGTVFIDDQIEITVVDFNPEEARGGGVPVREVTEDIMMGQYPARRINGYVGSIGGVTPQSIEQVIIPHNNRYYVFTVYELKRSEWSGEATRNRGPVPEAALQLFNSILSTLLLDA